MKVVLVSTYERKGGAAIACYRLKEALLKEGVDVMLLTAYKTSDDPTVITPFDTRWKRLKNRFHFYKERFSIFIKNGFSRKNLFAVSIADSGTDISALPVIREADIIHLHWVNQGFLSLQNIHQLIKLGKPMICGIVHRFVIMPVLVTVLCRFAGNVLICNIREHSIFPIRFG